MKGCLKIFQMAKLSFFILPSGYAIITFDFIFMKDRSPLCYFDNNVN